MLPFLDFLRDGDLDFLSILIRLLAATLLGGLIGIERERKRRPAGFRTHILICLGAAMTMLTSQYLALSLGLETDVARLGAQVVAGIGFIGAGTIIITKRRRVKGLTTAAGLWAAAIVGLCTGAGYLEGAVIATLAILIAEIIFSKLEYFIISNARTLNIFVEYAESGRLANVIDEISKLGATITDLEISKSTSENKNPCATISLHTPRKTSPQAVMTVIAKLDGIIAVEEL